MPRKKLLVVEVAALGADLVSRRPPTDSVLSFQSARAIFPAVTCTAQASFRTAAPPRDHGMIANGLFFGDLKKVLFWEQSASLVAGPRMWNAFRGAGHRVGMLFWQQSLGESVDVLLSPKPIHKHHGGMIQDCYSLPADLYDRLCRKLGKSFDLMKYWGPLASARVNDWIAAATTEVMRASDLAPDLLFTYLPGLDYEPQRRGPDDPKVFQALENTYATLSNLWKNAAEAGYDCLIYGDYNIEAVTGAPVYPNRALRDAGLLSVRHVRGMAYPDFFTSRAFAVADHQIAHVYAMDSDAVARARDALAKLDGIGEMLDRPAQHEAGLDASRSGALVLVAKPGRWIAYPWWTEPGEAPDYANHVDIHNKPGYDPCELFFGWPPMTVSTDASRVRGTHGRRGTGTDIAWTASFTPARKPETLLDLARAAQERMAAS